MKTFDYENLSIRLMTPEMVQMLLKLHEFRGREQLYLKLYENDLKTLANVAKIQNINTIAFIDEANLPDKRIVELAKSGTQPRNKAEEDIAGFRDVLELIQSNYELITPDPRNILQIHRKLYSWSKRVEGGKYKDNVLTSELRGPYARAVPVSEIPQTMEDLCNAFSEAWEEERIDRLLLIPLFIMDFLCIQPFERGTDVMGRLLSQLLLLRAGYRIGKYISFDRLIEKSRITYTNILTASTDGWAQGENDYTPFIAYYYGILRKAYLEFEKHFQVPRTHKLSKPDRIREIIDSADGTITKKEIMNICPDISKVTVERTLTDLVKQNYIEKVGAGPATAYIVRR